jgi:hypothetical protein
MADLLDDCEPLFSKPKMEPRELLTRFLDDRDVACPLCAYNLRNLIGDRCPECGNQIVLSVHMVEPRIAAMIAGLIGLSSGVGLNALLLLYGLMISMGRPYGPMRKFFECNIVGLVAEGAALAAWLFYWRRIRRQPRAFQRLAALGCWLLTAANLVYFTMNVK